MAKVEATVEELVSKIERGNCAFLKCNADTCGEPHGYVTYSIRYIESIHQDRF